MARRVGRRTARLVALIFLLWSLFPPCRVLAQSWPRSVDEHSWASFPVGSWKVVLVTTKQFDATGKLVATRWTRTETSLEGVADDECQLRSRSTITTQRSGDATSATISSPAQTIKLPLRVGAPTPAANARRWVTIGDQRVAVLVFEKVTRADGKVTRHTVWYSPRRAPYVLREQVEIRSEDAPADTAPLVTWDSQVTSFDPRVPVLDDRCRGWEIKAVRKTPRGTATTIEVHCAEVPGTLVRSSTTETNEAGRVVRQSVLELRAYGTAYSKSLSRRDRRRARRRAHHRKRGR